MDTKDFVYKTLFNYGTSNSKQISNYIKRTYKEDISSRSISGVLRGMVARGEVGCSDCGAGAKMYWLSPLGRKVAEKQCHV